MPLTKWDKVALTVWVVSVLFAVFLFPALYLMGRLD